VHWPGDRHGKPPEEPPLGLASLCSHCRKDAEPPVVVDQAKDAEPPVVVVKAKDAEPTDVQEKAKDAKPPVIVEKAKDAEPPVIVEKAKDVEPTVVEKAKPPAKQETTANTLVGYYDFETKRAYVNTAAGRYWQEGELWQAEPAKGNSSPVMARFGCEGHEAVHVVGVWWELFQEKAKDAEPPVIVEKTKDAEPAVVQKAKDAEPPAVVEKAKDAEPAVVDTAKDAEPAVVEKAKDAEPPAVVDTAKDAEPPVVLENAKDRQYEQGGASHKAGKPSRGLHWLSLSQSPQPEPHMC
jgi:hypothetical protein